MGKEVFTERRIEDAAYLNCPSVENEADWIYGFIAGGKYVKKEFESELEKIIKIKTIEKGWGESSIYFQANDQLSMPNRVNEIKEESKHIGVGEYGDLIITVYRGYIDEKMVFEIAANNDITLSFF